MVKEDDLQKKVAQLESRVAKLSRIIGYTEPPKIIGKKCDTRCYYYEEKRRKGKKGTCWRDQKCDIAFSGASEDRGYPQYSLCRQFYIWHEYEESHDDANSGGRY